MPPLSPWQRLTMQCNEPDCKAFVRVDLEVPRTHAGPPQSCSYCGSTNVQVYEDADRDYWEHLAQELDIPLAVCKELYSMWNPLQYNSFASYVAAYLKLLQEDDTLEQAG